MRQNRTISTIFIYVENFVKLTFQESFLHVETFYVLRQFDNLKTKRVWIVPVFL